MISNKIAAANSITELYKTLKVILFIEAPSTSLFAVFHSYINQQIQQLKNYVDGLKKQPI